MSRFLIVDVGAGTIDILFFDDLTGAHYKVVAKSPVRYISEKASATPGNLLFTGREMGGGSLSGVLRNRVRTSEVLMTSQAALTVAHRLDTVKSWGIRLVRENELARLSRQEEYSVIKLGDLQMDRLERMVADLGVPFEFDVLGVCAQDHGMPPEGTSHLDYRHKLFQQVLDRNPFPHSLLYAANEVPHTFNRLRSIAESGSAFPANEVYVMDSGMAAILGASMDYRATMLRNILVLDLATSHTVGAVLTQGELAGFFEYHTKDITAEKLDSLIVDLADGKLTHERVLEEGGHGAYLRKPVGFKSIEMIIATGPKRGLITDSRHPITYGAPLGDNMMTGTVGVLEAIRRREGKPPRTYL